MKDKIVVFDYTQLSMTAKRCFNAID